MDCNQVRQMSELINLRVTGNPASGESYVVDTAIHARPEIPCGPNLQNRDPISGTLVALDRRLEMIRKEQLAKNRASLRQLDLEQLQALEWVTTNITRKIFREVADELEHSASEDNGKRLSETVCLMLGLA